MCTATDPRLGTRWPVGADIAVSALNRDLLFKRMSKRCAKNAKAGINIRTHTPPRWVAYPETNFSHGARHRSSHGWGIGAWRTWLTELSARIRRVAALPELLEVNVIFFASPTAGLSKPWRRSTNRNGHRRKLCHCLKSRSALGSKSSSLEPESTDLSGIPARGAKLAIRTSPYPYRLKHLRSPQLYHRSVIGSAGLVSPQLLSKHGWRTYQGRG